jgi:cytochrome c-type biogenesis protein CcmH/NrfF
MTPLVSKTRREFLSAVAGALALGARLPSRQVPQDSLPGTGPAGRLWDPARAGRPLEPVTARDNDAAIQAIEKQLHCTCGCNQDVYTCRTTDFTCTTSPAMHRQVLALAAAGRTGPEIIGEFVREHGVAILMAPPKRGFNLAAYFLPSLALVVGAVVLTLVLLRRVRSHTPREAAALPAQETPAPHELERLRRELDKLTV